MRQTRFWFRNPTAARLLGLAAVVAASAASIALLRYREDREHLATGRAQWIWLTRNLEAPAPMRFVAVRDFDWTGSPAGPARALVFVDRSYVLFVNGRRAGQGGQLPGGALRAHDVSGLLRSGHNRIEIEAGSPDGAGGILFALELPAGATVVSDRTWRVGLSREAMARDGGAPAAAWGRPPMYPWGYPGRPKD